MVTTSCQLAAISVAVYVGLLSSFAGVVNGGASSAYLTAHLLANQVRTNRDLDGTRLTGQELTAFAGTVDWFDRKKRQVLAASVDTESACGRDLETLAGAVGRGELWALAFPDSVGKPQPGLLNGAVTWLGSFDQCLRAGNTRPPPENIEGSYCLLKVRLPGRGNVTTTQTVITIGTCWPASCLMVDVVNLTATLLAPASLTVTGGDAGKCFGRDREIGWTPGLIVLLIVLCLIAVCLVAGTAVDLFHRSCARSDAAAAAAAAASAEASADIAEGEQATLESSGNGGDEEVLIAAAIHRDNSPTGRLGLLQSVLLCFSIPANAERLLRGPQPGDLQSANGIRFLSMSWVVLGHTYLVGLLGASNLGQLVPQWLDDWTFRAVVNATVSVDTFFVLSGLLATFLFLRELDRRGRKLKRINWLQFYLHRYLRITLPYVVLLGAYATLPQHLWDGPRYPRDGFDGNCDRNWWRNLLFINNIWNMTEMCMPWSWYLANDMQFYAASPLVLVPLALKPALGVVIAVAGILASATALGVHSTQIGLGAGTPTDEVYTRPWFRVGPYLVGCLAGFAAHRVLGRSAMRRLRLPWLLRALTWTVAVGLCAAVIYGLFDVDRGRYQLSQSVASLYNSLFRLAWSVGVAAVILACSTGNGGVASDILSARLFAPLSRLSYCAYLIHPVLITAVETARRDTVQWNAWTPIGNFLAYLLASYAMAFVASLALESPLIGLEKLAATGGR